MQFDLTQEQQMIVDMTRKFVENEIMPYEDEVEKTNEVSPELKKQIQTRAIEAGLYAANMPEEFGGGGIDDFALTLMEMELGAGGYALQMMVHRPSNILRACKGDQIEKYLLPTIRGEKIDCLAMTEPEAGSDVRGMKMTAIRDGEYFVINGMKHFISMGDYADYVVLFAKTGEEETPRGKKSLISSFLVDLEGVEGLTRKRTHQAVSNRGFHHAQLIFDNVRIHESQLLGEEGKGFDVANEWLGATRLTVAATAVGRAKRVFDYAADWAVGRKQFGQSIGKFQGVSFKLADMRVEIDAAELLTLKAAYNASQNKMTNIEASVAKLKASEMLAMVTDEAIQIYGGMGLMTELPLERWWRDARVDRIWDGTSEIQKHIISREILRPLEG